MKISTISSKRLRLSLAVLSLASATTVIQPPRVFGGLSASGPCGTGSCNNGSTFCKSTTVAGTSVSCWKH